VVAMRSAFRAAAHVARIMRSTGVPGWSALFTPGPEGRTTYPKMAFSRALGPTAAAPYDPMHLLLYNVAPQQWRQFHGVLAAVPGVCDNFVVSAKVLSEIGGEYRAVAATGPTHQARALRDITKRYRSIKGVDWLFFLLSGAKVVLYGRVPDTLYNMTMCSIIAVWLLLHPSIVDTKDLEKAEREIVKFLQPKYADIYRSQLRPISSAPHNSGRLTTRWPPPCRFLSWTLPPPSGLLYTCGRDRRALCHGLFSELSILSPGRTSRSSVRTHQRDRPSWSPPSSLPLTVGFPTALSSSTVGTRRRGTVRAHVPVMLSCGEFSEVA